MKKTNSKRAFTIVELVIVIAVIAILAAVLIPTFSNIIKKAQKSSDTQLIRNLNNALAIDLAEQEQDTYPTAYEAFAAVERGGYNVSRIVAKSGYNIAYDTGHGYFVLLDEQLHQVLYPISVEDSEVTELKTAEQKAKYFVVRTKTSGTYTYAGEYSVYAGEDFNATEVVISGVGFDAGKNDGITKITYTNTSDVAKDVVIRTNSASTNIAVNAPLDTIKHYGSAGVVDLQKVATTSFFEYGAVAFVELNIGRIVLTETSDVEVINVAKKDANTYNNPIIADGGVLEVNMPDIISRDQVTVTDASGKTPLVQVQKTDAKGNVQGTVEQVYAYANGTAGTTEKTSVQNTTIASTLGIIVLDSNGAAGEKAYDTSDKEEVKEAAVETVLREEKTGKATEFAGGTGTAEDPFLIYDYGTMQLINDYADKGYYYFKVAIEKTKNGKIDLQYWEPIALYGSFDGNGVIINNLDDVLFKSTKNDRNSNGEAINVCTIKNMTLNCSIFSTSTTSSLVRTAADDLVIDSVNVHGQIVGYAVGGYVDYGSGNWGDAYNRNWQVTFKNCINDAKLVAFAEATAGFVQHPYCDTAQQGKGNSTVKDCKSLITIIDSAYTGTMMSNGGYWYVTYQGWGANRVTVNYSNAFIQKYGVDINSDGQKEIEGYLYRTPNANTDGTVSFSYGETYSLGANYRPTDSLNKYKITCGVAGTLPANLGDYYTFTKANDAVIARISYMISPNDAANESGSYTATYMSEEIDLTGIANGANFSTTKIKYCKAVVNGAGVVRQGLSADGKAYNIYDGGKFLGHTHNGANLYAVQYNVAGEVVAITSIGIEKSNGIVVMLNGKEVKSAALGVDYELDTGLDLSQYDVKVVFVDRDSTWYYNFEYYAEFNGTNVGDSSISANKYQTNSTFEIDGSKVIIHNVEKKADRYDYGSLRYGIRLSPKN